MNKSITVIIFAFNEEGSIHSAIDSAMKSLKGLFSDYEIIVMDDGSQDKTKDLALEKARLNERIRVFSNKKNIGCGFSFRTAAKLATKDYITVFPGDNDIDQESFRDFIKHAGTKDVILSYRANHEKRSFLRRFISKSFVVVMNFLFHLNLKYFTGPFICKRTQMISVNMNSNGLVAIPDYVVRFCKLGNSYKQVPFIDAGRESGKTKALRLRNFTETIHTVFILLKDVYWTKNL